MLAVRFLCPRQALHLSPVVQVCPVVALRCAVAKEALVSLVTLQSRLMAAMSLCAHLVVVCRSRVVHCRCTVVAARRCPVAASLWRHLTPILVAAARCLSRLARHQAVPVGPSLSRAVGLLVAMRVLSSCPSARVRLVPAVLSP